MEVTVLDTVSGRDLLMPGMDADMEVMVDTAVDMEVMADTDMVDTVERDLPMPGTDVDMVDTEDTDTLDMHTESKFCISMPMLPFILLYLLKQIYSISSRKTNQIIIQHVSPKVEEEF